MMTHRLACSVFSVLALVAIATPGFGMEGRAWGDIHVQTMDGATFDFQSSGEFVASRSPAGDLVVQLRLESSGFSSNVSVLTALAVRVDSTRASVALGREPMLYIDAQPAILTEGVLELPDGGRIEQSKRGYEIYWSDGSILSVEARKRHLNAFLRPAETRRGSLAGLFGNFNGIAADDLEATMANMGSESSSAVQASLRDLAQTLFTDDEEDGRLVTQEASLFEYKPGQSTWTFRKPAPKREATPDELPASSRQRAEAACREAGVTDPDLLQACIVDVGYTRDPSFAETAAMVQARNDTNWDAQLTQ